MERLFNIKGFSSYKATRSGKVYSLLRKIYLKPAKRNGRYFMVHIKGDDGNRYARMVHRLIAIATKPNPQNKPLVNHKDGDIFNNAASNLEWVTPLENYTHAVQTGLLLFVSKKVIDTSTGKIYQSVKEVGKLFGKDDSHLYKCLKGERKNKTSFKYFKN